MAKRWMGVLSLLATACSQAPAYRPPLVTMPATFHDGAQVWQEAQPAAPVDRASPVDRANWWRAMGDPALDALEVRLISENPDLAAALARHRLSLAVLQESGAALVPEVAAGGALTRNRQSDTRPLRGSNQPDLYGAETLGGGASYELDLWGRVADTVKASSAEAQASADDAAAVRLSLQADLVATWAGLRGADADIAILQDALAAYRRADDVTRRRYDGGIANGIDLGRAAAQVADAEAQLSDARARRAQFAHAVATLAGIPAGEADIAPSNRQLSPVTSPARVPATLLQRRPDIAAAERRMFAANRAIGVAQAARFPAILLGGSGGFQSTAVAGLLSAPNVFWSLGPQMVLPLFDGGRRRARIAEARAQWDIATQRYRATVLQAMREVEDNLTTLNQLRIQREAEARAATAAGQAARLSYERYIKGANSLLDVVISDTAELTARRRAAEIATRQVAASIALVRALGGDGPAT